MRFKIVLVYRAAGFSPRGFRGADAYSASGKPLREKQFGFGAVALRAMRLHPGDVTIVGVGGLGDVEQPAD